MKLTHAVRRVLAPASAALCAVLSTAASPALAQETKEVADLREPVYRVTKQDSPIRAAVAQVEAKKEHALDPAIDVANVALAKCRAEVNDYTCIIVKRERINGKLGAEQFMSAKVRNQKKSDGKVSQPFSVYLKFLQPSNVKGREVIYVEGRNNGKLVAHEGGWKGRFTPSVSLDPEGTMAMMGQRYPITDIGIEKLCVKLLERATRDRKLGDCSVAFQPATINGRASTRIEVTHPEPLQHLDFHVARVFVDDEFGLPIRYEAYDWPVPGREISSADLIEEYTYVRVELNPGLSDLDFDPKNQTYNMK